MDTGQDTHSYSKQNEGIKPEISSKPQPAHVKETGIDRGCNSMQSEITHEDMQKRSYIYSKSGRVPKIA